MTPNGSKELKTQKTVFDLDSNEDVTLFKVGTFNPIGNISELTARLGNNATLILEIINDGLRQHEMKNLEGSETPWQVENEEGALVAFTGTPISEEKSKQLAANVLMMAKLAFGFSKEMSPEEKRKAKDSARAQLLANPVVIEGLKRA